MKMTDRNALEIFTCGGAIAASDWKTGTGNYVKARPVPQKCMKIDSDQIESISNNNARIAAKLLLQRRPKVRKIIVVSDWEGVAALGK